MADNSQLALSYVPETTYGVTPATPAFKRTRIAGDPDFSITSQYVTSNEIRPDRNVSDTTLVSREASGSFPFELSFGSFDDFLEALLESSWTTNVLKNGVTLKSFTFEKIIKEAANSFYRRFRGQCVNTMSLAIQASQMITGQFTFIGKDAVTDTAIITGATYIDPNSNPVINAANNVAALSITGLNSPIVRALNLSISNNLRQKMAIGDLFSKGVGSGRCEVTGSLEMYFADSSILDLALSDVYTDLTFTLGGVSNKKYVFVLPKIKLTNVREMGGDNNGDVMVQADFTAVYSATDAASIKITRTP